MASAYPIIAIDLLDNKLESAKLFGATHTAGRFRIHHRNLPIAEPVTVARGLTTAAADEPRLLRAVVTTIVLVGSGSQLRFNVRPHCH